MTIWDFAKDSPFIFLVIVWICAWAFVQPFKFGFRAYNRSVRARNIAAHGWPTPPVDADGDVIYPACDCDDETEVESPRLSRH